MLNKLDAALSFHQNALRVRSQRQELIAGNIANADTPNYKARDIDFKAAMSLALAGQSATANQGSAQGIGQGAGGLNLTSSLHIGGQTASQSYAGPNEPLFRPVMQGSVDGNSVDMDVERNQFVDNGLRYEASINMINGQIKKMLSAIQGQ